MEERNSATTPPESLPRPSGQSQRIDIDDQRHSNEFRHSRDSGLGSERDHPPKWRITPYDDTEDKLVASLEEYQPGQGVGLENEQKHATVHRTTSPTTDVISPDSFVSQTGLVRSASENAESSNSMRSPSINFTSGSRTPRSQRSSFVPDRTKLEFEPSVPDDPTCQKGHLFRQQASPDATEHENSCCTREHRLDVSLQTRGGVA